MLQELEIAKRAEERLKAAEKQRNAKLLALEAEVEHRNRANGQLQDLLNQMKGIKRNNYVYTYV